MELASVELASLRVAKLAKVEIKYLSIYLSIIWPESGVRRAPMLPMAVSVF